MFFERCHDIGQLALRLCGQRVYVVQEELPFHRQPARIHQSLAAPFSIAFSYDHQLHRNLATATARFALKILANMEDMDIPIQHIGLVTTQRLISKSPDVVRRVVKSYVEGIQVMRTNPKLAKAALGKYMRLSGESELEETYQLLRKLVPVKPYPTLEGFRVVLDELSEKIPAAKAANPKDFTDTRYLEELDRSGYFDQISR